MNLSAKRQALARIHGRYRRAGRPHKTRILDEFCATCGYHRKATLRLLNRPLPEAFKEKRLKISPAQIDRLLRPARVQHPKKGLAATRPGTLPRPAGPTRSGPPDTTRPGSVEADTVAHCNDSTEGDYVNSLTFTELFSGWTENRAIWNKSGEAVLVQLKEMEGVVPYAMKDFHADNGGEFLNWALHRHLTGRAVSLPWTRSRAFRKNGNAHCEQKNWTHVRHLFGHDRFAHPELVALMNDLYAQEWSQFTHHFKPTFKLLQREKKDAKTKRNYELTPQAPYQRLLDSPDISEATKAKLRAEHARLDPFALKKSIEIKLKKFFTALGNLNREATKLK